MTSRRISSAQSVRWSPHIAHYRVSPFTPTATHDTPCTQEIMRDPVVAQDGHSYERAEITRWFELGQTTSPMTREQLGSTGLVSNITLRKGNSPYAVGTSMAASVIPYHRRRRRRRRRRCPPSHIGQHRLTRALPFHYRKPLKISWRKRRLQETSRATNRADSCARGYGTPEWTRNRSRKWRRCLSLRTSTGLHSRTPFWTAALTV